MTFSEHFKRHPQAVVYFIEDFVGNTGKRHHVYTPHISNGYYGKVQILWISFLFVIRFYAVLGYYSKASNPSHKVDLPKTLRTRLEAFYAPWNQKLRNLLLNSNIIYTPPNDIPPEYLNGDKLKLPKWLGRNS